MKKKRILYVITALNVGGAEMMLYRMLGFLNRDSYDLAIISLLDKGAVAHKIEDEHNLKVIDLNLNKKLNRFKLITLMGKEIKKFQPDIVHSHMYHANIATRFARIFYKFPILINTIHNVDESGSFFKSKLRLFSYRVTNGLVDLVTQVSKYGLEKYLALKAIRSENSRYIPNGIPIDREPVNREEVNQVKSELGLDDAFIFLAVGSLTKQKDYPNMLAAFARFAKNKKNTALLIAGGGPLKRELHDLSGKLNIADKVKFLGIRSDVPVLMHVADVYVLSSAWEGMPIVLLEAAKSKLPIIATDVGGNSEIVINAETGYLVPSQNIEALASAMDKMKGLSQEERVSIGEQAYNHVKANYGFEKVIAVWESIYEEKHNEVYG